MDETPKLPRRELTPEEKKLVEDAAKKGAIRNIKIGVGLNRTNGRVALQFSEPINLIELEPDAALEIGKQLQKKSRKGREIRVSMVKEGKNPDGPPKGERRIVLPQGPVIPHDFPAILRRNREN